MRVAVLFARADSNYKLIPGCDVWDRERDARNWPGGAPVIAHPPCRAWGRLRQFAKPRDGEKELAPLAVAHVRHWGGVLEHPASSSLWAHCALPRPSAPVELPPMPNRPGKATHCIKSKKLPCVTRAEREHTPPELARWLCILAARCGEFT